jgi:subtilisin family serine protease
LAPEAGHGTFIAGIIRQICPQAALLVVPVIPFAGAAAEKDIHDALLLLIERQKSAMALSDPSLLIDVVNLSLGYYHERPEDAVVQDGPIRALIQELIDLGVVVIAAAGNAGTRARFYPAAFAPSEHRLVSVGALNPSGTSVALFSNHGDWVEEHRIAAAVVSTVPTSMTGSGQAAIAKQRTDPLPRGTIDPDDYRAGFAAWSGTSFAAPVLAAEVAKCLLALDAKDPGRLAKTALDAVTARADESVTMARGLDDDPGEKE